MQATDTIVALSTPSGRSGIGVIRISGKDALVLTRSLLRDQNFNPQPNQVILRTLRDANSGEVLDRALVTYFKAPHSFTGEDVIELSCHGSPPLLLHVIDTLLFYGARASDPGEFTLRALANDQLNLTQAEAIRDLIDAQTHAAVRQAARQLGGELSARLQPYIDALLKIIVPLESTIEFVEDNLPEDVTKNVASELSALIQNLEDLAKTFSTGRLLKEGLRVTLVGRPNVGKSSIFNGLLSLNRAIVTDIPGTTRDSISEILTIHGIPIHLTDTAGMRISIDEVEQLGIERTRQSIADADLVVIILDGSQSLISEDKEVLAEATQHRHLIALNKSDLETFQLKRAEYLFNDHTVIPISAKLGTGLAPLKAAIIEPFSGINSHETDFVISNARHYDLLLRTANSLRSTESLLMSRATEELILVGLYDALRFLGEITGETTPDDVLAQIFSTFCIGK
ncbi:MAG: tRNA uridine-5-carboxymethylaminomethyl(34) synthesis GTPase MnmE [Acidobacteria bacterium]|nr:tRNA uridine-5-carboxymethylaminomethyl(34) synthesis GTPase MnmE [Acidobacteriota bacterium]